ncbi:DUF3311 domain-containing protein [Nocardioides sp. URHA0020]|uniref:DUF3311 domain-containing protein n=1 Tax=Nocardioides sp. URHA0020 TaxID=1380392 RepID=UPI0009E0A9E1|nr:DUF3311 domain-containing protein [Nocardioides sp. URHA0020]
MSDVPGRPGRSLSPRWVAIGALLAPAVVLPLWVALYDRADPTLFGFPFYFWFQFALILLAVCLTLPAYFIASHADRADRVRHGLPAVPDGSGTDRKAGDAL